MKFVGGKRRLLPDLYVRLPLDAERRLYVEPFVGGGSLFFALKPNRAVLGDLNSALIQTYQEIRYQPEDLIDVLRGLEPVHSLELYTLIRKLYNRRLDFPSPLVAAWFIYLNKTCFNGLYRENSKGEFNVPIGSYKAPKICDAAALRVASVIMRSCDLQFLARDFAETCALVMPEASKAFVYFDSPYAPLSSTSDFTAYTSAGFDEADQIRLRDMFATLDSAGAKCMLSNSDVPLIRDLYARYRIDSVAAPRSISAKGARTAVQEVIIRNY